MVCIYMHSIMPKLTLCSFHYCSPAALAFPAVETGCQALRAQHGDRQIISGVDIAQRLSGTSLKLLAYERLLQDYPTWKSKVVLV